MDVYDKVPTKVTTWLVLIPKLSIFILLFEIINIFFVSGRAFYSPGDEVYYPLDYLLSIKGTPETYNFSKVYLDSTSLTNNMFEYTSIALQKNIVLPQNILILSSLISLIIGSLLGLSQIKIKRLLAFSAISHIGFLLLSLSINTEISIESFFFYLIQYTITNLNIFLILLSFGIILDPLSYLNKTFIDIGKFNNSNVYNNKNDNILFSNVYLSGKKNEVFGKDINFISELKGVFEVNPMLSISLAICLFSLGGVPPLIGFFAKQQILYASISAEYIFLSFIAIIMSVISAYYYLKIIKVSHFYNLSNLKGKESLFSKVAKYFNYSPIMLYSSDTKYKNNTKLSSIKETKEYDINIYPNSTEKDIISVPLGEGITFIIASLTLIITLFIIKPNLLLNSTHILALNLFYI